MRDRTRRRRAGGLPRENPWASLVVGLTILGCGVVFWLDHLGRINADDYLGWWPIPVILFGLAQLARRLWLSAAIWIFIGASFLAPKLGYSFVSVWRVLGIWPLLISAAGLTLIFQALRPATHSDGFHALAVMAGNVRRMGGQTFTGGDAIAVMGGCEIDLSAARLKDQAVLDVLAFWGGIELRVPPGWRVVHRATTILGAYTDSTDGGTDASPLLVVRGSLIMGGMEVKNTREFAA